MIKPRQFFLEHLQHFTVAFDPVKDRLFFRLKTSSCPASSNGKTGFGKINLNYLFPLITILLVLGDALFQFAWFADFQLSSFLELPSVMSHKFFPKHFWTQADVMFYVSYVVATLIYANLLTDPLLHPRCEMFLRSGNDDLVNVKGRLIMIEPESTRLLKVRKRAKFGIKLVGLVSYLICCAAFTTQVYLNRTEIFRDLCIALYILTLFGYIVFCKFQILQLFLLSYLGLEKEDSQLYKRPEKTNSIKARQKTFVLCG